MTTHVRWSHGQTGARVARWCAACFVGGWEAWPIDTCSNKEVGRRECKPFVQHTGKEKEKAKETETRVVTACREQEMFGK